MTTIEELTEQRSALRKKLSSGIKGSEYLDTRTEVEQLTTKINTLTGIITPKDINDQVLSVLQDHSIKTRELFDKYSDLLTNLYTEHQSNFNDLVNRLSVLLPDIPEIPQEDEHLRYAKSIVDRLSKK